VTGTCYDVAGLYANRGRTAVGGAARTGPYRENRPPSHGNLSITPNPSLVTPGTGSRSSSSRGIEQRPSQAAHLTGAARGPRRDEDTGRERSRSAGGADATVRRAGPRRAPALDELARHGPAVSGRG